MTYELILSDEAKEHMKVWRKSGQKKTLKKIADLFEVPKQKFRLMMQGPFLFLLYQRGAFMDSRR